MQPILNLTPEIYEAVVAAFALVSMFAVIALVRKSRQLDKTKSVLKTVVTEATKGVITSAMFGAMQVARARAETRKIVTAANEMLTVAEQRVGELEAEVAELREENTDDRIDDLEEAVSELVAESNERAVDPEPVVRFPFVESRIAGFPFGRPDPLAALFGSLGISPTGRVTAGRDGPSIKAFKITPDGLVPVNGPEDFLGGLASGGTTFNRPTPSDRRQPSLVDILSLLATLPTPRPRPGQWAGQWAGPDGVSAKADLASAFLYDEHGPAAPGDDPYARAADAARASVTDGVGRGGSATAAAEACDTQRPAGAPEPQTAPLVAGGALNVPQDARSGSRSVPRYDPAADPFASQSPRAG